jgi:hypothetical protein
MNLASLLAFIPAAFWSGVFVTITGYCPPYMITSSFISAIGAGFLTTFTVTTSHSKWIWYQVLVGFGIGLGITMPTKAIQASLPTKDVKTGIAVLLCAQTLAAAIFSSVAQSIFVNKLISGIKANFPHVDPTVVLRSGILNLKLAEGIDGGVLPGIYNKALVDVFYLATALIAFSIFGALSDEWRSVKSRSYAGGARAENEEGFARRVYPWSALRTYVSNIFSKLWNILISIRNQRHTEEPTCSLGQQMKQNTAQNPALAFGQLCLEWVPGNSLDDTVVQPPVELPASEPVGMELHTSKSGTMGSPEEWPVPLEPLPLLFATAELRNERTRQTNRRSRRRSKHVNMV